MFRRFEAGIFPYGSDYGSDLPGIFGPDLPFLCDDPAIHRPENRQGIAQKLRRNKQRIGAEMPSSRRFGPANSSDRNALPMDLSAPPDVLWIIKADFIMSQFMGQWRF